MQLQINQLHYDIITSGSEVSLTEFKVQAFNFHCTFNRVHIPRHTNYLIKLRTNYFRVKVNPEEVKGQI